MLWNVRDHDARGGRGGGGMTRLLLVAAVALVAVLAAAGVGAGAEWHVHPGGSIQDAIDGAGVGDTIYVHAGMYDENVDVWKRVTLEGAGADVVTVRAGDAEDHVFNVTADWVNMSGFAVTGATDWNIAGICLGSAYHCNIFDNNASNNNYGIHLYYSSNNMLSNNTALNNSMNGIHLISSSNNMLSNNTALNNSNSGIVLYVSSNNNTLIGNTASNNFNPGSATPYRTNTTASFCYLRATTTRSSATPPRTMTTTASG
jgi:parallel beta-helix repeat protein